MDESPSSAFPAQDLQSNMDRLKVPYLSQDPKEIGDMLKVMNEHAKKGKGKGGFFMRKKAFELSDGSGKTVESWQMNDWDYKKPNLPTYARGLFTTTDNGKPEIVVRGYDKFFNNGEVNKTQWSNIEQNTRGPYELSVKENGCIIFIAGFDDETLIVTSKHSTGPRQDVSANHAGAGEARIDKQLAAIGKTKAQLARTLRGMNATAVAELCDDAFEEHVLQYTPEQAGLYLHGINLNLPEFATYPGNQIEKFADEWGFRKVQYVMMEDINKVKPFLDEIAETGNYDGRDTEGFVVRCQARDSVNDPWHDWFFKYKFEEPYLMYRQWREVTKAIISGKPPKYNKHKQITSEYITYARRQLAKDPNLGKRFNQNHGIIAMREAFLAEKGLRGGDIIQAEEAISDATGEGSVTKNVVLVPIATLGCGKTTVAFALNKLVDWGHEQNDNIVGKNGRAKKFAIAVTNSLAGHSATIADRNNHQRRERHQIIDDVKTVLPDATFVALHYVHNPEDFDKIRQVTQDRVLARGDNHQTIQAATQGSRDIIGIMEGFLNRFEPVDPEKKPDNNFDLVIDLDVTADSTKNVKTVLSKLNEQYPHLFTMPSADAIDAAVGSALAEYKPNIKHDVSRGRKDENKNPHKSQDKELTIPVVGATTKPPRMEYFLISLPAERIGRIVEASFADQSPETSRFYNQLKATRRMQATFHVTLIHRVSAGEHAEYWKQLSDLWTEKSADVPHEKLKGGTDGGIEMAKAKVQLERVVWDDRVMAIVVRLPDTQIEAEGSDAIPGGFQTVNKVAHITVGTANDKIKPRESNDLLEAWMNDDTSRKYNDLKVKGNIILDGSVRGMISR